MKVRTRSPDVQLSAKPLFWLRCTLAKEGVVACVLQIDDQSPELLSQAMGISPDSITAQTLIRLIWISRGSLWRIPP